MICLKPQVSQVSARDAHSAVRVSVRVTIGWVNWNLEPLVEPEVRTDAKSQRQGQEPN